MRGSMKDLGNGKYKFTVSDGTGLGGKRIRHYKTVEAKSEAEARHMLSLFVNEVEKGNIKNDDKMTVKSYSEVFMRDYVYPVKAIKTAAGYEYLLKRINDALGHIRLSKLRAHHLTAFYNMLREDGIRDDKKSGGLSENTISHYHRLLSVMLETARLESDLIPENPARKVKDPPQPKPKNEVVYYDDEEAIKLMQELENAPIKYKVAFTLIIFTGFRKGEILGLEWPDINMETGELNIYRGSQYVKSEGIYTDGPKTRKALRSIIVPSEIIDLLKQYKAWQNEQRLKCGEKWVPDWNQRLFTQWNGKPMHPSTLNNWMLKFFKNNSFELKQITPHGLRHTYATLLIGNGVDVATVSENMGHAKKSTTLDVYTGAIKKKSKVSAEVLGKTLLKKDKDETKKA